MELKTNDLQSKYTKYMNTIAKYGAYYRANIHRFVEEYLGIKLKLFQKILIYEMNINDAFMYIASRGQGKTFLVALFASCRCILYPHTQCLVVSHTFKQGKDTVRKITEELMQQSPMLRNEIKSWSVSRDNCGVIFKNGSYIKVGIADESTRGSRSNLLIIDEVRLVPKNIIDTILRPTNVVPRQAGYLYNPNYEHLQEMNKEIYMSSAFYTASELYDQAKSFLAAMLNPSMNYFICDLPYQLSIKEGLLMKEQIKNEMMESTFNDVIFSMEREGIFFGSNIDALYDFKTINKRRVLAKGLYPLEYYTSAGVKIPEPATNECRVLSVDVAILASKKHDNDASAFIIHSGIPTSNRNYLDNVVYIDTFEGLMSEELGLTIMRFYYQYKCHYIALDANGVGQPVLDYLMSDRYDPMFNATYPALNVVNRPELQERCKVKEAPKVIYALKYGAEDNDNGIKSLRGGFQNGYISLLVDESEIENEDGKINVKGYTKLSDSVLAKMEMPYIQTTLLISELINLDYEVHGRFLRVKEKSGYRKDRFSSMMYGYAVLQEIGYKKLRPKSTSEDIVDRLTKSMKTSSLGNKNRQYLKA